jgi:hypothetical protein
MEPLNIPEIEKHAKKCKEKRLVYSITEDTVLALTAEIASLRAKLERVREAFVDAEDSGKGVTDDVLRDALDNKRIASLCVVRSEAWFKLRYAITGNRTYIVRTALESPDE